MKKPYLYLGLLILIFAFSPLSLLAQENKKIEIISAKELRLVEVNGKQARQLLGNVKLKQGDVTLACERALFYIHTNAVDAFQDVHIYQGNGSHIYSDSLKYDGETKQAEFFGRVKLTDPKLSLETDYLIYSTNTRQAAYYSGAHVVGNNLDLISRKGYYYADTRNAYFKDSVVVKGSNYSLFTDTLRYDIESETSHFYGPTDIVAEGSNIYCESGWYNTNTDESLFGRHTVLYSEGQILKTDSLYYSQKTGYGKALAYFEWIDTTMDIMLSGKKAVFYQKQESITATDSALLTYLLDGDSLFLTGDTLISNEDSLGNKQFFAYYNVKLYKSDLQGLCDSLSFSFADSLMRMYFDPVLWNTNNQMTGDTITLTIKNQKLELVELYPKGFIVNEASPNIYNQIKGKHIYGYFKANELDKLLVKGNGESAYYGQDEDGKYVGLNVAKCSDMWIYMLDSELNRIKFLDKPDATFHPIQQINPSNFLFNAFKWRNAEQPKSKADLFKPSLITPQPIESSSDSTHHSEN